MAINATRTCPRPAIASTVVPCAEPHVRSTPSRAVSTAQKMRTARVGGVARNKNQASSRVPSSSKKATNAKSIPIASRNTARSPRKTSAPHNHRRVANAFSRTSAFQGSAAASSVLSHVKSTLGKTDWPVSPTRIVPRSSVTLANACRRFPTAANVRQISYVAVGTARRYRGILV